MRTRTQFVLINTIILSFLHKREKWKLDSHHLFLSVLVSFIIISIHHYFNHKFHEEVQENQCQHHEYSVSSHQNNKQPIPKPIQLQHHCKEISNRVQDHCASYALHKGWLQSLRCEDKLYVYDKDLKSWKVGTLLQKTERNYKTQNKYILKIQIDIFDVLHKTKYFIFVTINKLATTSSKIRKYTVKCTNDDNICKATHPRSIRAHHNREQRECNDCKREFCSYCLFNTRNNQYLCHDCIAIIAEQELYTIVSSDVKAKQQHIQDYFSWRIRKSFANHSKKCAFCKQEYRSNDLLYSFSLCTSCATLIKTLMQIRWISAIITTDILVSLCAHFRGYIVQCTNYLKCQKEIYIPRSNASKFIKLNDCFYSYYERQNSMILPLGYSVSKRMAIQYAVKIGNLYLRLTCTECSRAATHLNRCDLYCYNVDYGYNPCLNHPSCNICNNRCRKLYRCSNCETMHCHKCGIKSCWSKWYRNVPKDWCKHCVISLEYNIIDEAVADGIECNQFLLDILDMNIVNMIAVYARGFIVDCMACCNEIVIDNKYEFMNANGLDLWHYMPLIHRSDMKTVLLFSKQRRIFCAECVVNGTVNVCKVDCCSNYDEYEICGLHQVCELCYKVAFGKYNNNKKYQCYICRKHVCPRCYIECIANLCYKCVKNQLLRLLLKAYIVDKEIIDVIDEYAHYISIPYDSVDYYMGNIMKPKIQKKPKIQIVEFEPKNEKSKMYTYQSWNCQCCGRYPCIYLDETYSYNCDAYEATHYYFDKTVNLWENEYIKKKFNGKYNWKMTSKQLKTKKKLKKSKIKKKRENVKVYLKKMQYL